MEKKHMKKIDKYDVITFIICLILDTGIAFAIEFYANDELWNFSNIYKMTNGFLIYKDLNVIITPLFFYIGEGLFKILGSSYLTFRIYNVILVTGFMYFIYMIFKEVKMSKKVASLLSIIVGMAFILPFVGAGANYNLMAIELFVLGMFLNIKIDKNSRWSPWIQGIIAFLIFYTKQNVGIYYLAAAFFMHLVLAIKEKEVKREIIQYIKQVSIFTALFGTALVSLYVKGNLYDFIDMCFLGIHDFANNNVGFDWVRVIVILVSVTGIIYSFLMIKLKNVDKEIKAMNLILLPYMLFAMLVMYPIFNVYHIYLATIPTIIFFTVNVYKTFLCDFVNAEKMEKIYKYSVIAITSIYIIVLATTAYGYVKNLNTYIEPYYGSRINSEQIEKINKIVDYMKDNNEKGIDVKVISHTADLYMNVLNKNNGKLDLPFYGNFGSKGEQGIIDEINNLKNCRILILKDDAIFYQESKKVIEYIKNNLEADGEIGDYLIYKK